MPPGRTMDYSIWRACEMMHVRPPDVEESWDECNVKAQAKLLAYFHIREIEENKKLLALHGAKI